MTFYKWSTVAANNAGADPTQTWAEGMAPSAINDSARALLAAAAKYRDDTAGHIAAGGSASAYTVTTSQGFTSTTDLNAQEITFIAPATNALGVTLSADGIGAFPLATMAAGTLVPAGSLATGGVYTATFYNSISLWLLRDFYVNPFNIPLGGMMDYICASVPNSNFVFPIGQAISRTTYAALFALTGTIYGVGDGSTTFNVPDLRGRVAAGADNMGGVAAGRLTSASGMGAGILTQVGGAESHTLTVGEIPSHSHANTLTESPHSHSYTQPASFGASGSGAGIDGGTAGGTTGSSTTGISINNANVGGGGAHAIVQPTIIVNKILRII